MLKQQRRMYNTTCLLADLALLPSCFLLAYALRAEILPPLFPGFLAKPMFPLKAYLPILVLSCLVILAARFAVGTYRRQPTLPFSVTFLSDAKSILLAFLLALALAYALRLTWLSRVFLALMMICFLAASSVAGRAAALWHRRRAGRGAGRRVVVLVGSDPKARELARRILGHPELGLSLRGFFEDEESYDPAEVEATQQEGIPYLGDVRRLPDFLRQEVVDGVFFAAETARIGRMEELFLTCEDLGVDTLVAASFFPHLVAKVQLEHLDELALLRYTTVPHDHAALFLKRCLDAGGAAFGLLVLSPILLLAAILIKATSPGPFFFRQERMGLNGRRFTLLKFRTMVADAEKKLDELKTMNEADGPVFKIKDDPRVTPLGRFLRRSSVDELPQLWNVLKGEMSLVGPRPPIPSEVEHYERWQRRRLSMRPGLTCLWQISGRSELDFNTWMKLDLHYIDHWSLPLDLVILLKTIPAVLSARGAA